MFAIYTYNFRSLCSPRMAHNALLKHPVGYDAAKGLLSPSYTFILLILVDMLGNGITPSMRLKKNAHMLQKFKCSLKGIVITCWGCRASTGKHVLHVYGSTFPVEFIRNFVISKHTYFDSRNKYFSVSFKRSVRRLRKMLDGVSFVLFNSFVSKSVERY